MTTKKLAEELEISPTRIRQLKQELGLKQPEDWVWAMDDATGKATADFTEQGAKTIRDRNNKSGRPTKKPSE